MSKDPCYVLQVGEAGRERLEILNAICNPFTFELFDHRDLSQATVLDLGCGIGIVSEALSHRVAQVHAMDISREQLAIARTRARPNMSFHELSCYDLGAFQVPLDMAYSRFLLCHLKNPEEVITSLHTLLKPGGVLVLEETTGIDGLTSHPHNAAFAQWADCVHKQLAVYNTDLHIGCRLPALLRERGFRLLSYRLCQPLLTTPYEKSLLRLNVAEVTDELVRAGLAEPPALQALQNDLTAFEQEEGFVPFLRYAQVVAQKE